MNLVKTSGYSLIATIVRMLSRLVITKIIAIYIGPTGLALIGQFQNFSQIVLVFANGAVTQGVTKYTAEYVKQPKSLENLFSTSFRISLFTSIAVGIIIIILSKYFSLLFLHTSNYTHIFIIFGITIVLYALNSILLAILNGLKEIKFWFKVNIIQSIYSLIFTTLLIFQWQIEGALIAMVTNQSVIFFVVLWLLRKHPIIKFSVLKKSFNQPVAKKLLGFSTMALTTAIVTPIALIVIRNYIGTNVGWTEAGYWQAIWYISTMYLTVVTSTLAIYYLPKLSEIKDKLTIRKEIWNTYKLIMPIVFIASMSIYLLQDFIILLLFSEEFSAMKELFLWQLIGDTIKIASWLLAYMMLAKAMTKAYIATEVITNISFVLLSIFYVNNYGLIGVTYAFAVNYLLYLVLVFFVTYKVWCPLRFNEH